ncbi:glycogen-binding domain-containing protein [Paenibacillus sp. SI8]|uniref:glycogen-binding domain-containing protein n=1 Tax=unclassified Paenibacillus TaxID=185978 RepID=UPI0034663447
MKNSIKFGLSIFASLMIFMSSAGVALATSADELEHQADVLNKLNVFKGGSNGLELDNSTSRIEGAVMLVRLLGKEKEALIQGNAHPFSDIPAWADPYIGYLYHHQLTSGSSPTQFGSGEMTAEQYCTFVLRVLGYDDKVGDFDWSRAVEKLVEVGVLTSDDTKEMQKDQFLRKYVVIISYNALQSKIKGQTKTLVQDLIEKKAFAPEDVIQANDGSLGELAVTNKTGKWVVFKYFSSTANQVYLAGDFNQWSPTAAPMSKQGNWFTAVIPLNQSAEYKFVVDGEWTIDPFSLDVKGINENSYVDPAINGTSNFDKPIHAYASNHFEYFTLGTTDKTAELEKMYATLTERLLAFWKSKPERAKIRYYGMDYTSTMENSGFNLLVPFAKYATSEVYDMSDVSSSHELIHTLIPVSNSFFNEGMAQCFQIEGNKTYVEQNVSLNAKQYLLQDGSTNLLKLMDKPIRNSDEYHKAGSFVFFHMNNLKTRDAFTTFLKSLRYEDNVETIKLKYKDELGVSLETAITQWENWLKTIDANSDVYVKW